VAILKKLEQERRARIAKQRATRDRVIANRIEYNSTHDAFIKLGIDKGWNTKQIELFRVDLKAEREMIVEHDGKEYHFSVVPRRVSVNDYRKTH
jgi:hypothetical protein